MEIISLKIRTADEEYGRVLQEVLCRNYPGFLITVESLEPTGEGPAEAPDFTNTAGARRGGWGVDLSLCDDKARLGAGEVLLVDLPGEERLAGESPALFKYQPAKEMVGKILKLCEGSMHREIFYQQADGCRIVAAVSASGGRGCSTVCRAAAQMSARLRGKRPVYMELGQFSAGGRLPRKAAVDEREYMVRLLREEGEAARGLLEQATVSDPFGCGFFTAACQPNPLFQLTEHGMQKVLGSVCRDGLYDLLFIDIGSALSPAAKTALRAADAVLFLESDCAWDREFLTYLRGYCGGDIEKTVVRVRNRYREKAPLSPVERFYLEEDTAEAAASRRGRGGAQTPPQEPPAICLPYEESLDPDLAQAAQTANGEWQVFPLAGAFADAVERLCSVIC